MKRKMVTILLTAAMTASMLAGCGDAGTETQSNAGSDTETEADSSGDAEESTPQEAEAEAADAGEESESEFSTAYIPKHPPAHAHSKTPNHLL